jgi:hypothetical protein
MQPFLIFCRLSKLSCAGMAVTLKRYVVGPFMKVIAFKTCHNKKKYFV